MDSKEEILAALEDFNRKAVDKVPPLLERYLNRIAATGETLFAWSKLRPLLVHKMDTVMKEFYEKVPTDSMSPCSNVPNSKFEEMRQRLLLTVNEFTGAPFTIQRLCELVTNPQKHYKQTDKFMRGIAKNLLVVSTVDPYGNKIVSESSKVLVNGMDANGYEGVKLSPDTPPRSFFPPPAPASSPTANGTTNGNNNATTSSTSPLASSWFSSSPASDSVSPWGGGGILGVKPTDGSGDADSRLEATALSEAASLDPQPSGKDVEVSETSSNSSSSSGSSSSSELATLPLGEVDKDSGDSNESADTSESSSSSDGSLNDTEVERQQGDVITDATATSLTQTLSIGDGDGPRDVNKRPLENPVNPENKRLRLSDSVVDPEECASSELKTEEQKTCEVPEDTLEADQQSSDNVTIDDADTLPVSVSDDSLNIKEDENLRDLHDSHDSLGFDAPFEAETEADPEEEGRKTETDQTGSKTETDPLEQSPKSQNLLVKAEETETAKCLEQNKSDQGESQVVEKQIDNQLTGAPSGADLTTGSCPKSAAVAPPAEQEVSKEEGQRDLSESLECSKSDRSTTDVNKPQEASQSQSTTGDKDNELSKVEVEQPMETD